MTIKTIFASTLLMMGMVSCQSAKNVNHTQVIPDAHTSQTSLDWAGTYSGILPCLTCSAMETELELTSDNEYVLTQTNYNREAESKVIEGRFTWKENHIILDNFPKKFDSNLFKVEEGRVRMLDKNGNIVTGESENKFILTKNGNAEVENSKWVLIELYGKKIKGDSDSHYVVFHSENKQIEAKAGCNQLTFGYKIKNGLRLEVTPGISTMMACPDEVEETFKKMMMEADNISVNEKTLTLNKARMAPLAVFEIVE